MGEVSLSGLKISVCYYYQATFDDVVKLSLMFVNGEGDYDDKYDNGDGDDVVIVRMMVLYMWIKITLCYHYTILLKCSYDSVPSVQSSNY